MPQTLSQLNVPTETYLSLERIASFKGVTPLRVLEEWVAEHESSVQLKSLRSEYRALLKMKRSGLLSSEDAHRLNAVCDTISDIELSSERSRAWERNAAKIDEQLAALTQTIASLPMKSS